MAHQQRQRVELLLLLPVLLGVRPLLVQLTLLALFVPAVALLGGGVPYLGRGQGSLTHRQQKQQKSGWSCHAHLFSMAVLVQVRGSGLMPACQGMRAQSPCFSLAQWMPQQL